MGGIGLASSTNSTSSHPFGAACMSGSHSASSCFFSMLRQDSLANNIADLGTCSDVPSCRDDLSVRSLDFGKVHSPRMGSVHSSMSMDMKSDVPTIAGSVADMQDLAH